MYIIVHQSKLIVTLFPTEAWIYNLHNKSFTIYTRVEEDIAYQIIFFRVNYKNLCYL